MIKLKKILQEKQTGLNEIEHKYNGKTLEEWLSIFRNLPYDDMIEASELLQYHKTENLLRTMKKQMKYI